MNKYSHRITAGLVAKLKAATGISVSDSSAIGEEICRAPMPNSRHVLLRTHMLICAVGNFWPDAVWSVTWLRSSSPAPGTRSAWKSGHSAKFGVPSSVPYESFSQFCRVCLESSAASLRRSAQCEVGMIGERGSFSEQTADIIFNSSF
jgi:hypothetical protein